MNYVLLKLLFFFNAGSMNTCLLIQFHIKMKLKGLKVNVSSWATQERGP